jgi:hypothetical protein
MNITKDYFENFEDEKEIDENFIKFHKNPKTYNIVLDTFDRSLGNEDISKFRVKFDANAGQRERIPIYLNSNANISGNNTAGFTFEGVSYEPYNPEAHSGEIIGFHHKKFDNENGILIQKRFSEIQEIGKIRIEIPKIILSTEPSFLYLHFDELSGFSKSFLPNGKAITFCAYSSVFHENKYVFETRHPLPFDSFNLQNLTFEISFPKSNILNDYATIFYATINNSAKLELVTPNMPTYFVIGDELKFETGTEIVPNVDNIPHVVSVIDGYIDGSTVILRTFDGELIDSIKTVNGKSVINFGSHNFLIATSQGGVDISIFEKFDLNMKTLVFPYSDADVNITPITTILTDYIVYNTRKDKIKSKNVKALIENFEVKYGLINSFTDYIEDDDIRMAYLSYQIVSTLKTVHFLLNHLTNELVNPSSVSLLLSQYMIEKDLNFTNFDNISEFFIKILSKYKVNITKYALYINNSIHSLIVHNTIKDEDLSFGMLANSALVLHKDITLNKYAKYNIVSKKCSIEEISKRRDIIVPSKKNKKEFGEITEITYNGTNEYISQNLEKVKNIYRNILYEFKVDKEKECLLPIQVKEFETCKSVFGKISQDREIFINTEFDIEHFKNCCKFNNSPTSVYMVFFISAIKSILSSSDFKLNLDLNLNSNFLDDLRNVCEINEQSIFTTSNDNANENVIEPINVETDVVIDIKESEKLVLNFEGSNTPIKDIRKMIEIETMQTTLENGKIKNKILFSSSKITSSLFCILEFAIDDKIVETRNYSVKVNKRKQEKIYEFSNQSFKDGSNIKVSLKFSFEKGKYVEVFNKVLMKKEITFLKLEKICDEDLTANVFDVLDFEKDTEDFMPFNPLSSSPPLDSSGNIDYTDLYEDLDMKEFYTITNIGTDTSGNSLIELDVDVDNAFNGTDLLVKNKNKDHYINIFNKKAQVDVSLEIVE